MVSDLVESLGEVEDRVRFLMPTRREYQFAAMAVVQKYVNGYGIKAINEDASAGRTAYSLQYQLAMAYEDFVFFQGVGLTLNTLPQELRGEVSMLVDMRDEKLEAFRDSGKHVTQVCGMLCGVLCRALPQIRKVRVAPMGGKWLYAPLLSAVMAIRDFECTGIIADAGAETYLAAAKGLAVIELVPATEPEAWRTKWNNILYRRIAGVRIESLGDNGKSLIDGAIASVESMLKEIYRECQQPEVVPEVFPE